MICILKYSYTLRFCKDQGEEISLVFAEKFNRPKTKFDLGVFRMVNGLKSKSKEQNFQHDLELNMIQKMANRFLNPLHHTYNTCNCIVLLTDHT